MLFTLFMGHLMMPMQAVASDMVIHERVIEVTHPGRASQPFRKTLVAQLNANGDVTSYSMVVDSVVCLDVRCEVIPVTLRWDVMGRYLSYDLPQNGRLTKTDHVVFTPVDYQKLHDVLSDRRSLLKDLSSERIVDPNKAIQTADGVSAPTPVSLQQQVVVGATYTCYTLWHWANGEVADIIRNLTAETATLAQLLELYSSGGVEETGFALELLAKRNLYSKDILDSLIPEMPAQGNAIKASLQYLYSASRANDKDIYFDTVEAIFAHSGKTERIHILESLSNCPLTPPDAFYDSMSQFLPVLESYYEVHLLITLEEQHNTGSKALVDNACKLLESDNFLIARRAYWFLQELDLVAGQSIAMAAFREKHSDRL